VGELYEILKQCLEREEPVAAATLVGGVGPLGAKMLVMGDGTRHGGLGDVALEDAVARDALEMLSQTENKIHHYAIGEAETDVYIEVFPPPPVLLLIGAGHVSIPLAKFAKELGYTVKVIDPRAAFNTRERFPMADEIIVEWPDEVLPRMPLHPAVAAAVLTHDPKFDEPSLKILLNSNVGYIGAIGSRKTGAERNERLRAQGITEEQIRRIHGPIGLNIGAVTPEEMALAIMAQIVAVRHGRDSATATLGAKQSVP